MRRRPPRPSATPPGPFSADPGFRARYRALCEKYADLVDRYEAKVDTTSSVTVLALAAMRAGETALAAIRAGRFLVRNDAWLRLAAARSGGWRVISAGEGHARERGDWPTIEALVLERANEVMGRRRAAWAGLCERGDGRAFAEVRIERAKLPARSPLVLVTVTDVTGRVRDEEARARLKEEANEQARLRAVGELASGIAHDLNNALHAIRLRLARVQAASLAPSEADDVRAAERIAAEAAARVRRLQDLAGRREAAPVARTSLRTVVDQAVALATAELREGGAGPRVAILDRTAALPDVDGDADELRQVVAALVLNARGAMPRGGTVTVSARPAEDGGVELVVEDEGTGIAPEHLARLFDPFFTTKGTRRGAGLGLSIAANVMRRLGGSICAENRRRGGARFRLRFPRPQRAPPEVEAPAPAPAAAVARRVLVVDDDVDNLDAMRLLVEQLGHHVEVAETGGDAIGRVEAGERYDIVLCDLGLGDASGWDVASALHARTPGARFYLVTGWAEEIPRDDPRRGHVVQVLPKPLDIDALKRLLAEPVAAPVAAHPSPPRTAADARPAREPSAGGVAAPPPA
jgi:signal transduction histidine kinase/CheY-like chemotaxis protein